MEKLTPTEGTTEASTNDSAEVSAAAVAQIDPVNESVTAPAPGSEPEATLYNYDRTYITLTLVYFPDDGHEHGRMVGCSVKSPDETPLIAPPMRSSDLILPDRLIDLLDQYRDSLPQRESAHQVRVEQQAKLEKARSEKAQVNRHTVQSNRKTKTIDARPAPVAERKRKTVDESQTIISRGLFDE